MTKKFYPVRIKQIEKTTSDCTVISFDVEEQWQPDFQYKQGQHLTLKATIDGQEVRRSYSLCSSPLDGEWKVAIKKVPQGSFSTYANEQLRAGDTLEIMPPNGRFYVEVDPDQQRHFVAFAAGSGITPILSIIKTHLQREPQSSFQLFYVNRATSSIILKEEIESLKNKYLDRFEVYHFLTQEERNMPLFNGRIDAEKLELIFRSLVDREATDEFFICGPAEMIFAIKDFLTASGVDPKHIHFELFNTDGIKSNGQKKKRRTVPTDGSMSSIEIIEGGKKIKFRAPKGAGTILDAALRRNADLPFACKGGVCCTCKAKLLEGEVDMEVNYALEQEQLDAGYILSCQAVPMSDTIKVDFDA
ncbi:1,2-phenylacetyl-CoA epoxidase subunit PaaE [Flavilitoribacter nigricans]|uniref:Phenylacetic acid degradation protein n=1 Tax=Flavilitoribacter nigricans (strain ATCC 23147 / DSM 23189 / NBRC 102662 / NCIMB 1420 / SS-2) TaxID=1122177 RepID=A0A2D0NCX2_FLAN2|nr:1,2-phenylacetyl-CoA epoxidase subunit PaaE [Flavilitoribacter nigricans]PHN06327.1 phenylacetic acid degradation protein [Flavilitoribacter nigricans DSM 23189 = NBRC 102662]